MTVYATINSWSIYIYIYICLYMFIIWMYLLMLHQLIVQYVSLYSAVNEMNFGLRSALFTYFWFLLLVSLRNDRIYQNRKNIRMPPLAPKLHTSSKIELSCLSCRHVRVELESSGRFVLDRYHCSGRQSFQGKRVLRKMRPAISVDLVGMIF